MTGREHQPEVASRWTCRHCHDSFESPMPMPAPAHLCPRTGRIEAYVPAWSPERAAAVEQLPVRRLRAVAA